jgi:hypothetical protein
MTISDIMNIFSNLFPPKRTLKVSEWFYCYQKILVRLQSLESIPTMGNSDLNYKERLYNLIFLIEQALDITNPTDVDKYNDIIEHKTIRLDDSTWGIVIKLLTENTS